MSQSSTNSEAINCFCGKTSSSATTWKNDNVGRRFLGCGNYPNRRCSFFRWLDPPLCERAKQIIPGLLRRLNEPNSNSNGVFEVEMELLKVENKKLQEKILKLKNRNKELTCSFYKIILVLVIGFMSLVVFCCS